MTDVLIQARGASVEPFDVPEVLGRSSGKSSYFFLLLFIIILLMDSMLGKFSLSGGSSPITVLGASFCLFLATRNSKVADGKILWVILPLVLLALLYIFLNDVTEQGRGQRNGFFLLFMVFIFYCGTQMHRLTAVPRFFDVIPIIVTGIFCWLVVANSETSSGFAATKNAVSGLLVHVSFMWLLLKKAHNSPRESSRVEFLTIAWLLLMSIIVSHRTFLAVLFICLTIVATGRFFPKKSRFLVAGVTVVGLLIGNYILVSVMANLNTSDLVSILNDMSDEYFNRRFTSGRETLWYLILYALNDNIWMGLGPGVIPSDFIETDLSSHNSYLQVLLQMGIVGVTLMVVPLLYIAFGISKLSSRSMFFLALVYFITTIIHSSFEVILTQNNFPIAAMIWVNLGILFSISNRDRKLNLKRASPRSDLST